MADTTTTPPAGGGATAPVPPPAPAATAAAPTGKDATPAATAATTAPSSAAPSGANAGKTDQPAAVPPAGAAPGNAKTEEPVSILDGSGEAPAADIELKLPEGVLADAEQQQEFKSLAKELKLDSAGAQKLIEFSSKVAKADLESAKGERRKLIEGWQAQAKADSEYGGKDFQSNMQLANKAVRKFGGEPLAKVLRESGLGSHPDVIRAFFRAGKGMSEDSIKGTSAENGGVTPTAKPNGSHWDSFYEGKMGVYKGPPSPSKR